MHSGADKVICMKTICSQRFYVYFGTPQVLFRDVDSLIDVLIKLHNGLIIIIGCVFLMSL